jgi:hypothetical protein
VLKVVVRRNMQKKVGQIRCASGRRWLQIALFCWLGTRSTIARLFQCGPAPKLRVINGVMQCRTLVAWCPARAGSPSTFPFREAQTLSLSDYGTRPPLWCCMRVASSLPNQAKSLNLGCCVWSPAVYSDSVALESHAGANDKSYLTPLVRIFLNSSRWSGRERNSI